MTMTSEVKLEPTAEEIERVERAIVLDARSYKSSPRTMARAAILAMDRRASPPAPAVAVKPLEWVKHPTANLWRATTIVGFYIVYAVVSPASWKVVTIDGEFEGTGADAAGAKAAAQADYEQRIRSALVEPDQIVGSNKMVAPAPAVAVPEINAGIKAAAAFVRKRLDNYIEEYGAYDPDTGVTEFPGNGDEYVEELETIVEGILARAVAPAEAVPDGDPECTCCGGTGVTYQTERRCACQGPAAAPVVPVPVAWMNADHIRAYQDGTGEGIAWASPEPTDFYSVPLALAAAPQPPARGVVDGSVLVPKAFLEFVKNAPVSSGVCCCGDNMDGHADPMSCGHTPRDQWEYSLSQWLEEIASPPAPAVAVPGGWQDISTAPQDELLNLYEPHEVGGFQFIGIKNPDGRWYNNLDLKEQHPTHWAPCRPAPLAAAAPQPPATRSYEEGKE